MTTERPPRDYDAVLFDMDGVLLQGVTSLPEVYREGAHDVIESEGLAVPEDVLPRLEKYAYDEQMERACRRVGIDPERFWQLREQAASRRANRLLANGSRDLFPDTAVIPELPTTVGVVSNNRDATVRFVADELLPGDFALAMGREPTVDGFRKRKPNSYYLKRALDRLGVDDALYVGDRQSDIEAAYGAGIDGAFLRRDHNGTMTPEPEPTVELNGLADLRSLLE